VFPKTWAEQPHAKPDLSVCDQPRDRTCMTLGRRSARPLTANCETGRHDFGWKAGSAGSSAERLRSDGATVHFESTFTSHLTHAVTTPRNPVAHVAHTTRPILRPGTVESIQFHQARAKSQPEYLSKNLYTDRTESEHSAARA
jgi:hypothetical protein